MIIITLYLFVLLAMRLSDLYCTLLSADPATNTSQNRATQVAHRVVLGTFNVAEQGDGFMPDLNRV